MKHKVSELEGALLDAAVAMAEGLTWKVSASISPGGLNCMGFSRLDGIPLCTVERRTLDGTLGTVFYRPSTVWSDGGPIIERERLLVTPGDEVTWHARLTSASPSYKGTSVGSEAWEPTLLIAAMRAYVASKFGAEVELP